MLRVTAVLVYNVIYFFRFPPIHFREIRRDDPRYEGYPLIRVGGT